MTEEETNVSAEATTDTPAVTATDDSEAETEGAQTPEEGEVEETA
ncbi:MAG: hypothetical protein R3B53_02465 [Candidatus Paceibacterota bacterium]